jgi:hypothetical protein
MVSSFYTDQIMGPFVGKFTFFSDLIEHQTASQAAVSFSWVTIIVVKATTVPAGISCGSQTFFKFLQAVLRDSGVLSRQSFTKIHWLKPPGTRRGSPAGEGKPAVPARLA